MKNSTVSQISTVTLFRFRGTNAFWIFGQMQKAKKKFEQVPGLQFFKLMGSGGKNGFSKMLNVNVYALHCVWKSEQDATNFFKKSETFSEFKSRSTELYHIFSKAVKAHGLWDGTNPYEAEAITASGPILVITRARIKLRFLLKFWRHVPSLGKKVDQAAGSIFSIGIGEYPWFMQATFSIWDSYESMRAYAYGSPLHMEVVKKTRELGWYSEELFANFIPYKTEGSWEGLELDL
ncbi:spheroidene monooxygenase [Algoriphagus sp.]|uniref:spheroidene monooxygenase n=1 Tax=Algoriphagus sp. TaxID=1872435 RepID=UPI00327FA833